MLGLLTAFFAVSGIVLWVFLLALLVAVLQIRPWDASNRDHSIKVAELPYAVFAFGCYCRYLGAWLVNNVPAPMLAIDIASAFLKSQVLFAVVNLGVAEALQAGPQTASQLAHTCNCSNVEWLDRLLKAAAVLGIVSKRRAHSSSAKSAPRTNGYVQAQLNSDMAETAAAAAPAGSVSDVGAFGAADEYEYFANHVTACLCKSHKSSMAAMVKLYEYNYTSAASLTKSLQGNLLGHSSHQLQTGQPFWQHLASDPVKGAVFDEAMHSFKDLGGSSVLTGYNWDKFSHLVDVAGGNGSFLASLLTALPGASGAVVDQQQQVQRGKEWWRSNHPELLQRASFIPGDIFSAGTVPAPPAGKAAVAYMLRNILHNWPDSDAVKILRSIRAAISAEETSRVRLVLIELTSSEGGMPPLLEPRLMADIQMLTLFGSGKERDVRQFEALLAASGFSLVCMVPTVGLLMVLEAQPV